MKKTLLFILIALGITLIALSGILVNRKFAENEAKKPNLEYEYILEKEMYGTDVVTIINKAMDNNKRYEIAKDKNGNYINDNRYSIQVEIAFQGMEENFTMEKICTVGLEEFMQAFNVSKFKCINKEYHTETKRLSKIVLQEI